MDGFRYFGHFINFSVFRAKLLYVIKKLNPGTNLHEEAVPHSDQHTVNQMEELNMLQHMMTEHGRRRTSGILIGPH